MKRLAWMLTLLCAAAQSPSMAAGSALCRSTASIDALLAELGDSTDNAAVKSLVFNDAIRYYTFKSLMQADPGLCRPCRIFEYTSDPDSLDGDRLCRRIYYEAAFPRALITEDPQAQSICREKLRLDEPQVSSETARGLCAVIVKNLRDPQKICASAHEPFHLGIKREACLQLFNEINAAPGACANLDSQSRAYERCRALAAFRQARAAHDPKRCGASELCRVFMGEGDAILKTYASRIEDSVCAAPAPPTAKLSSGKEIYRVSTPEAESPTAYAAPDEAALALKQMDSFMSPLREDRPDPPELIALGRLIFFDPRLSHEGTMSCSTCHQPAKAWTDGLARARGYHGEELPRNTPSLLNVRYERAFGWDGRTKALEEQVLLPIENPKEMHSDLPSALRRLSAVPAYEKRFEDVFGTKQITPAQLAAALTAFVRSISFVEPSPFERFRSDPSALSAAQKRGFLLFVGKGNCAACHPGPTLTYGTYRNIGVKAAPGVDDPGRYAIVAVDSMRGAFRTPSLLNVALDAAYMHNGSLKTLQDVVDFYDRAGDEPDNKDPAIRPLELTQQEKDDLVSFLTSLSSPPQPFITPILP